MSSSNAYSVYFRLDFPCNTCVPNISVTDLCLKRIHFLCGIYNVCHHMCQHSISILMVRTCEETDGDILLLLTASPTVVAKQKEEWDWHTSCSHCCSPPCQRWPPRSWPASAPSSTGRWSEAQTCRLLSGSPSTTVLVGFETLMFRIFQTPNQGYLMTFFSTGGCNGCLNLDNPSNFGLEDLVDELETLYEDEGYSSLISR